jgi:hypothetical protein
MGVFNMVMTAKRSRANGQPPAEPNPEKGAKPEGAPAPEVHDPDDTKIGEVDPTPTRLPPQKERGKAAVINDPELGVAMERIQAVMNGQGAADPVMLLGRAHVRIAQLEEALQVAITELIRRVSTGARAQT